MKVLVSTDTSCLVNNESLKKYDIKLEKYITNT